VSEHELRRDDTRCVIHHPCPSPLARTLLRAALRVHGTQTDARAKFDGERRRVRRVPGVPAQNPSTL